VCYHGTEAVASDGTCVTDDEEICTACNDGYTLATSDDTCNANTCTCSDGTEAVASDGTCLTDDTEICTACNDGYTLENSICNANTCTCSGGTEAVASDGSCVTDGDEICTECNAGYNLESNSTCTVTYCEADEYVRDHVCTTCTLGKTNTLGDDASGDATHCDVSFVPTTVTLSGMDDAVVSANRALVMDALEDAVCNSTNVANTSCECQSLTSSSGGGRRRRLLASGDWSSVVNVMTPSIELASAVESALDELGDEDLATSIVSYLEDSGLSAATTDDFSSSAAYPSDDSDDKTGLIVGVAVGGAILLCCLLALVFYRIKSNDSTAGSQEEKAALQQLA